MSDVQGNIKKPSAASKRKRRKKLRSDGKARSAYRTISEVADELDVAQHVLRFWETKFKELEPLKRGGGRRYYRPEDVVLLKKIHNLLYTQGFTIKGVQKLLKKDKNLSSIDFHAPAGTLVLENNGNDSIYAATTPNDDMDSLPPQMRKILAHLLDELKELRSLV